MTDSTPEIAWSYFEHLNHDRLDEAVDVLHPDGTWWTCGTRQARPMADHIRVFPRVLAACPMRYELINQIVDGNSVVLEAMSHADLPDGKHLNNVYAFVARVEDGRIVEMREYSDTAHLAEVAGSIKQLYANG